jgi:fatty acid synthase, animal type
MIFSKIHAIEGVVTSLYPLAAKLKRPVYGLQCVADAPLESIASLACFYIEQIKTIQPTGPYTIVGYSFGGTIAFEMIAQLEKAKQKCNLLLLDGAPQYVSWYTEAHKQRKHKLAQDESYALAYFAMNCAQLNYTKVVG